MVLFYESEQQIWFFTFLLIGVIYPIVYFYLIVKADKPKPLNISEVLESEEKSLIKGSDN
ncbi:MAG: hypothetical protein QXI37_00535 [Thermoprotei archaeon]